MKIRMPGCLRYIPIAALFISGCATAPFNREALDAHKKDVFHIGIVKTMGGMPILGDDIEKKREALSRIPTGEICDLISAYFGLGIEKEVDRTIYSIVDRAEGQQSTGTVKLYLTTESAYYGNKKMSNPGRLAGTFGTVPGEQDEGLGNMVYITYKLKPPGNPFCFQDEFAYDLSVKADTETLIHFEGLVARVKTPKRGLMVDVDGTWDNFVSNTTNIPSALKRDIEAALKKFPPKQNPTVTTRPNRQVGESPLLAR